ncbi:SPOR domain-containing protein [Actimicrobium sp. CCC2.4]|nr:SPOR domain-containing protein [Actimicrobium sp. CCC2.4]WPX34136.1 SPOR domain-containing protein [Actimicrobium sp. CCC2.4]
MGLSSFFRKKPPEPDAAEGAFYSRSEEESGAVRGRAKAKPGKTASEPVDPVLPEKKRARRRLVGAVTLVLAAVIGLPMVLDSEPPPLGDDVLVQMPSKDLPARPSQPKTAAVTPPAAIAQEAALDKSEEVVEPASVPQASAGKRPAPVDQAKPMASADLSATPESKSQAKPEPKPEPKPEVRPEPEPKPEAKPEPTPAEEKAADSARAMAILDGSAARAKPADKKSVRLVVQVAALATKEKVDELQDKLKTAGINSYTQTISTDAGQRIRVRIGPFSSQEEADKVRARLNKIGLSGTVVPS